VTPSFNQGEFIEETIRSVLLQGYPNLEYVVIDGGSSDASPQIIEKYAPWLSCWVSEPDRGHFDAVNKGFAGTRGEIMAWINSDDKYAVNAFAVVGEVFAQLPAVEWVTSLRPILWRADGRERWCRRLPGYSREAFWSAEYVVGVGHFHSGWIQQESTFWRRSLWHRAGGRLDPSLRLAGDFELWARFFRHAELHGIVARVGGFRRHDRQRTRIDRTGYIEEAAKILEEYGGKPHGRMKAFLRKWISRLPALARKMLAGSGLVFPGEIIMPDGKSGGWRLEKTVV
jgi:glycosyltransferase involved in cell wall biosynthesis